jgi:hypothetical protein
MHPGRGKSPVRRHGGVHSGKSPYARDGSKSDSIGKASFPLTDLRVFLRIYVFSDFFMLFLEERLNPFALTNYQKVAMHHTYWFSNVSISDVVWIPYLRI